MPWLSGGLFFVASPLAGLRERMSNPIEETTERARQAREIAANPADYKVCEGCESIVTRRVVTCPNCHGYRFDASAEAVVAQATSLGSRERRSVIAEDLL